MLRRILFLSLPLIAASWSPMMGAKQPTLLSQTITDEAIIYPESFEVDTQKILEGWYIKNYTATDDRYRTMGDVKTSDEEIKRRLAAMPCAIEMPFNQIVRQYIDRYTQKGRAQVAAMLGMGTYYNTIFEQALEEEGLPLELKYLPVIESALNPNATSRHGAAGLWQFMLATGKGLGMEINTLVDERRDPYISSRKAAKYLKDLHSTYNDWSLAIAAYNCGPGTVNKAIRRAGGEPSKQDFWSIYSYLPAETRGYFPLFIAANYVMTYYPEHNISPVLPTKPLITDTIGVNRRVHFDQISAVLNIPKEELRVLNPQFRADVIPGTPQRPYQLILPSQQIHAYILSEDEILGYQREQYAQRLEVNPGDLPDDYREPTAEENNPADFVPADDADIAATPAPATPAPQPAAGPKRSVIHTVAEGETLADIAGIYGVSPSDVRKANNLRRNAVRVGQQLRIETSMSESAIAAARRLPAAAPATPATPARHEVAPRRQPEPVAVAPESKKKPAV
ncbi:MAG: transglycosylase SLT domain-containing protein, partial [Muribaculaceae bacterium]|nr:transglycosylase SLT domain-containing protein [Muribaculaceae bacterium]